MKLATALYQLRSQPEMFLRHNLLWIAGQDQSGIANYTLGYHGLPDPGVRNEAFMMVPPHLAGIVPADKAGVDGVSQRVLPVHVVRMIPSEEDLDLTALPAYTLGAGGPDFMVTAQLSGCAFAIQQQGAQFTVAHVQPGSNRGAGVQLRQALLTTGRFQGHGAVTHVFGVGDYHGRAHLVGLRLAGTWHFYAQQVATGTGPVTDAFQIL